MEAFQLPADLERFAGANLPAPAKMMTAKGLAPLKPAQVVTSVFAMTLDADDQVSSTAKATIAAFPETILKPAVDSGLAPAVLDCLARSVQHEAIHEAIALYKATDDETIGFLAERGTSRIVEIIANNQERLLRFPAILDSLGKNPATGAATIDRVLTFLQREGVLGKPEEQTNSPEMSVEEFVATLDDYELPQEFQLPDDLAADMKDVMPEDQARSLYAKVLKMNVTQKIKLAIIGNKEARTLLIRDPNKLVSTAVIKSPKIGEEEVIAITFSRTVGDHILRHVARNRDWTREYRVKLGLAQNPKTPFDIALSNLKLLRESDLSAIAKSKSVSSAVSTTARRMVSAKDKSKG